MNQKEIKRFGRKKAFRAISLVVVIILFILMLTITSGDFANGILFFLQAITNIYFVVLIILLFILTPLFGELAGKDILTDKKNVTITAMKYLVLTVLFITIYLGLVGFLKDKSYTINNLNEIWETSYLESYVKAGLLLALPLLIVWLWVTNQLAIARKKSED